LEDGGFWILKQATLPSAPDKRSGPIPDVGGDLHLISAPANPLIGLALAIGAKFLICAQRGRIGYK
jgi:hypothetical protein